jgi:hypothetical protein
MSGDHAKKEMVTGEKPATSHGKAPSGESDNKVKGSPSHDQSRRSGEKKKKMKKVVYYETDSSSPSTSSSDTPSVTSKRHERKKFSKIPLRYPRISKHTPLLSVPLGKPPMFDCEDYCQRFETGGSLSRRVNVAACPSPDGSTRGRARKGEVRWPEIGVREVEIPRPPCSSRAQVRCACSRGLQASTRERERAASSERLSRPRPHAANPL